MSDVCCVLLVEDNPGDARLIEIALASDLDDHRLGSRCELVWKQRLAEAVETVKTGTVSAVLLDLSLPDSQGLEGLAAIRAASAEVPILVLTGSDDGELATEALRNGAQDYLLKARLDGAGLRQAIRYGIERKLAESQLSRARWLAGIGETAIAIMHEINNPLMTLLGNAEVVDESSSPDEMRKVIESMAVAAGRIRDVVRKLGDLEQPRSVAYVGNLRMIDLSPESGRDFGRDLG